MSTTTRICTDQRLPCPTPHMCEPGCWFNEAVLPTGHVQELLLRDVRLPGLIPMATPLRTDNGGEHVHGTQGPRDISLALADLDHMRLSRRQVFLFKISAMALGAGWVVAGALLAGMLFIRF